MPTTPPTCLRCQSVMDEGILLDRGHGNTLAVEQSLEGTPERSFWLGIKATGRERFTVTTYRCPRCGYLESSATEPVA